MLLQNQVCTPQQANHLNELGITQGVSQLRWYRCSDGDEESPVYRDVLCKEDSRRECDVPVHPIHPDITTSDGEFADASEPVDAYSLAELFAMLPIAISISRSRSGYFAFWPAEDGEFVENISFGGQEYFSHAAHLAGELLVNMISMGSITASDCNSRLNRI